MDALGEIQDATWTGGAGDWATGLLVGGQPTLSPEPQSWDNSVIKCSTNTHLKFYVAFHYSLLFFSADAKMHQWVFEHEVGKLRALLPQRWFQFQPASWSTYPVNCEHNGLWVCFTFCHWILDLKTFVWQITCYWLKNRQNCVATSKKSTNAALGVVLVWERNCNTSPHVCCLWYGMKNTANCRTWKLFSDFQLVWVPIKNWVFFQMHSSHKSNISLVHFLLIHLKRNELGFKKKKRLENSLNLNKMIVTLPFLKFLFT